MRNAGDSPGRSPRSSAPRVRLYFVRQEPVGPDCQPTVYIRVVPYSKSPADSLDDFITVATSRWRDGEARAVAVLSWMTA